MPLFDAPKSGNPRPNWSQMSLDYKLMFAWHGCMMFLFIAGGAFTLRQEITVATILLVVLVTISMRNRRASNWHWAGAEPKQRLTAAGTILATGFFLFAASPLFPPSNPNALPWYLAGLGIGTMNFLIALRLVRSTQSEFLADCQGAASPPAAPEPPAMQTDPNWKRILRGAYSVAFFLVWLNFLVFFYISGKTFRDGLPAPTATHTDPMTQHGHTVYVTHDQKILADRLMLVAMTGIPAVLATGAILHFLVGVKIFDNTPTLRESLNRKSTNASS